MIPHLAPPCGSPPESQTLANYTSQHGMHLAVQIQWVFLYTSDYPALKSYFLLFSAYLPTQTDGSKNVFQDRQTHPYILA